MSRPVRVLRIIDRLNVGGPTKHVTWLCEGLERQGFASTLVTGTIAPGEGDMAWFARAAGVRPLVLPSMRRALGPSDAWVVWQLWRLMVRLSPDVVHTHKAKAGAVGRAAALLYRWATPRVLLGRARAVRVVHTFHGHTFEGYHGRLATRVFVWLERVLARLATDRIVTISPRQRDDIVGRYRIAPAGRTVVIPLGLEPPGAPAAGARLRRELGAAAVECLIGAVGRLCEVKDHGMLLEAMAILRGQGLAARLAVVGDGHLRQALEARTVALGLAGAVHYLGFRDDVEALYGELDVVALTSVNEGTPLTLLEAMAAGRAVAATAVGGVPDIMGAREGTPCAGVTAWSHGVTTARGDAAAFARALRWLAETPAARARMGACAARWVREHRSTARLLRDVGALYETLVGAAVEDGNEGADHGRSGVHRLASRGALPRARRRGVHPGRPLDGVDREPPRRQGASRVHVPGR